MILSFHEKMSIVYIIRHDVISAWIPYLHHQTRCDICVDTVSTSAETMWYLRGYPIYIRHDGMSAWIPYLHHQMRCDICVDTVSHYNGVIMSAMASQMSSLTIVYSAVYSGTDQRKYQSSAPLAVVREIHRWQVNFPHKGPVTRKMFPFDDVIMMQLLAT